MAEVKTEYKGIEITYGATTDKWEFEVAGLEKTAATLREARGIIDTRLKKTFERFDAWRFEGDKWVKVIVTSFAENWRGEITEAWVSDGTRRAKVAAASLVLDTPDNVALIEEWVALRNERDSVVGNLRKKEEAMVRVSVPTDL